MEIDKLGRAISTASVVCSRDGVGRTAPHGGPCTMLYMGYRTIASVIARPMRAVRGTQSDVQSCFIFEALTTLVTPPNTAYSTCVKPARWCFD